MKTTEFPSILTYKELVSKDRSSLFLIFEPDLIDVSIQSLYISEGRVAGWGVYEGDDPDWIPPCGEGQSAECVMQEDFFDRLFLEIPQDNPLFDIINNFLEMAAKI